MYEFQGTADQALAIKLIGGKSGDWQLNPYLVLLGPDRRVIAADDNTSRQRIAQVQVKLPTNGTYTILASNREAKESGRYSVVVETDPNRYSLDESRELSDRSQRLTQDNSAFNPSEFQGEQGKTVTIRASSYSFFPALILLDPDGQIIARNNNKAGDRNVTLEYRLPKSGTYKAIVNSLRPEDRGSYRLTISTSAQGR
jgi:serine protease Do